LVEAHRGTLFLDEVSSFSLTTQPKLLRVLETHLFRPVGARTEHRSEFRTLAATNEDIDALIAAGRFRRDLRRRLSEFVIRVPPLCDRRSDIPLLAQHFAQQAGTRETIVTPDALRVLDTYDWPDNVRELRQVVTSALALSGARDVTAAAVIASLGDRIARTPAVAPTDLALGHRRLVKLLDECQWNTARVADRLGVNRSTVYRRMVRYGVTGGSRPELLDGAGAHSSHAHADYEATDNAV
jgi:DNA-binding NtrC family response regulator